MPDPPLTSSDPTLRATGVALTSGPAGALAPRTFLFAEGGGVLRMRISGTATVVPCHDGKSLWRGTLVTRDQGSKEEPGHSYG